MKKTAVFFFATLLLTSYFSRPSGTPPRRWLILPLARADEYEDLPESWGSYPGLIDLK